MCKRRRHFLDTNIVDNHDIYTLLHEVSGITCVIERPRSSIEGLGLLNLSKSWEYKCSISGNSVLVVI